MKIVYTMCAILRKNLKVLLTNVTINKECDINAKTFMLLKYKRFISKVGEISKAPKTKLIFR